jgi:hypothetical protein
MKLSLTLLLLCIALASPSLSLGAKLPPQESAEDTAGRRGLHYWHLPRSAQHIHVRSLDLGLGETTDDGDELAARAGAEQELKFLDKKPWGRRSLGIDLALDVRQTQGAETGFEPTSLASGEGGSGSPRLHRRIRPDWVGDTPENRRPGWRAGYTPPGNNDK